MIHASARALLRSAQAWLLAINALACASASAHAQDVGQCVRVKSSNSSGVPVHARAENSFTGNRLPNGSTALVLEADSAHHWFRVQGDGAVTGWIVENYIDAVVPCPTVPGTGGTPDTTVTPTSYRVATWNLEHFHEGTARGFPEYTGATAIPPRTDTEYQIIAAIIRASAFKILILEEINGEARLDASGDTVQRSAELDRLLTFLGPTYAYEVASSGDAQRIALLWDNAAVHLNWSCEADFANPKVNGKGLFDREPLLGYFTFFANGQEMNDLVVVGVHLASGQDLTSNHDQAMQTIQQWIADSRADNSCIPSGELDVLIGGDFNANRFDDKLESFWGTMETGPYDVLADSATTYMATRLSGVPPERRNSIIDYIIISDAVGGLGGNEITSPIGRIHDDLVTTAGGGMAFRRQASDHIPVSVEISVTPDVD